MQIPDKNICLRSTNITLFFLRAWRAVAEQALNDGGGGIAVVQSTISRFQSKVILTC